MLRRADSHGCARAIYPDEGTRVHTSGELTLILMLSSVAWLDMRMAEDRRKRDASEMALAFRFGF